MGFTKLWSEIVTSSIWSADDKVRILWVTMLALSDSTGFVAGSVPGLADVSRMTLEDCERALAVLTEPDPYSRSEEFGGRRLDKIDGGWLILNYGKWREKRDPEERREYMREYMRRRRANAS